MSKIEVNEIVKASGSTLTLGGCGTAVTLGTGATQSGFGRTGTVDWQTGSIKTSIIAHELQEIFPDLVVGEKDAVNEDGTPELQRFKDKDLTIYLVKAVQELSQKVDSLEAQLSGSR